MNIIYLTWGETPRASGVYGTQVISQLEAIKKESKNIKIKLIAGIPIIHSGLIREKFSYKRVINLIQEKLEPNGFEKITINMPQNILNHPYLFKFFHLLSNKILQKIINDIAPDIIHCRSYHATYAAVKARQRTNKNYKIIFDARGLWPEQYAVIKNDGKINKNYLYLKELELLLLKESDLIVSVSETMSDHYKKIGINPEKIKTIYTSSPINEMKKPERKKNDSYSFCYLGALDENGWHKPSSLAKLFTHILDISPKSTLKIITKSSYKKISIFFAENQLKHITFHTITDHKQLNEALNDIDIGILSYFTPKKNLEKIFASTVIAIKTGEYLSQGIPLLVNKYCGGAADYVERHSIGKSYDPDNLQEITGETFDLLINKNLSIKAIKFSNNDFSYNSNAQKYIGLYTLIGK